MSRAIKISFFALVAAAQLAAPAYMIGQREWILRHGTLYKFRTEPVDPYDPFRGRYVMLGFVQDYATWAGPGPVPLKIVAAQPYVFATLTTGADGFAQFSSAGLERPAAGDYLHVRASSDYDVTQNYEVLPDRLRLELPFDRYYMNERKAPEAERTYREHNTRRIQDAYVTVRVWKGRAVLEELYIAELPIREFINQHPAER
jgi:uncharacterized membrane-anchored protein